MYPIFIFTILLFWPALAWQAYARHFAIDTNAGGSLGSIYPDLPTNTCNMSNRNLLVELSDNFRKEHVCNSQASNHDHKQEPIQRILPPRPWTKDVICMPENDPSESFCVFSNESFANGRGISIFTDPKIAEHIAKLPAFTKSELYHNVNTFDKLPWEIKSIPGKGNGLFATRPLQRGDIVVAATPLGVYQSDALRNDYALGYEYLHATFMQLPKSTRQLFMSTVAHYEGDPIMERINTNAFSGEFEGSAHFLLYPETARINHACRPNTMTIYDPLTLIHTTLASRRINVGEEITLAYMNTIQSLSARQSHLHTFWGFKCTCSHCSLAPPEVEDSDARIARIQTLQQDLEDWSTASKAMPQMAEELIGLYEKEELHAATGLGCALAALAYSGVGDAVEASRYARRARGAGVVDSGVWGVDEESMMALERDPMRHWSWKRRNGG